jgi:uncharacterized YccA/Bax inhibitor family protein
MALMSGSPVLTDDRFGRATTDAYVPGRPTTTMTVNGAVRATGALMVLLVASAFVGWQSVKVTEPTLDPLGRVINATISDIPTWTFAAVLVAFVFALITMFRPKAAPVTAPLYALAEGVFIGALSHVYNFSYDGIVTQALFATLSIFTVMLLLYATRIIKVTNRFMMVVVGATAGIFVMYLLSWIVGLFGVQVSFLRDGSPLALGISVFIIIIAALNLAIDFAFIEKAALHEAPKYLEWYAGFGVMVTLVWIYLEVLRLLAMLNRRN